MTDIMATRESLLNRHDRRYVDLAIGGVTYTLQSLTNGEMRRFRDSFWDKEADAVNEARHGYWEELLIAWCWVDHETKARVLTDEDVMGGCLTDADGATVGRLFDAAREHTQIQRSNTWEAIQDKAKNLTGSTAKASSNGSPSAELAT